MFSPMSKAGTPRMVLVAGVEPKNRLTVESLGSHLSWGAVSFAGEGCYRVP